VLTYAIGFVLDVQLACFAVVLSCMALQDRENRSLRWLAFGYLAGLAGAILDWGGAWLPHWLSMGLFMEAAPIGYACFYTSIAVFVRRGERARWLWVLLLGAALPFFLYCSVRGPMLWSATLQDFLLAVETGFATLLLLATNDRETRWPRRVMGGFLTIYSLTEVARVLIFFLTGNRPDRAAPWVETGSGIVYAVACGVLPLGFIWMMNARLLVHLSRQSMVDPLTDLLNRRGLMAAAEMELARYARSRLDLAVVVLDVDYFKKINDEFGHVAGDAALCALARFLRNSLRETDVVGRIGGEEFVLVLPGTPQVEAQIVVERLRVALMAHPIALGSREARMTASFGVTSSRGRVPLIWETLQQEADAALYAAKRAGRNVSRMYEEPPVPEQKPARLGPVRVR
jgi:diguanylate cyclase (GGDEF)-like protein